MGNLAAEQTVRTREYLTQREIDKLMAPCPLKLGKA
jgi:hypothetical protein